MQNCPKCQSKTDVYDSRLSVEGEFRRKRKCRGCGYRYATIEVLDAARPLDERQPKPKAPPKPKKVATPKPAKTAKVVREKRVRQYDDDEYTHSQMDYDAYDVARDLGIGDFT
jgi:transcriptional regulator NrdR family protein